MNWEVLFHQEFVREFRLLPDSVQDEILVQSNLLKKFGPQLGRPRVDTLKGSRHANMKELRFDAGGGSGEWHLFSIPTARQFYWFLETSRVEVKHDSTAS